VLEYIVRRLLSSLLILFLVSIIVFLFLHMIPGDPARMVAGPEASLQDVLAVRRQLGLDHPLYLQFWLFLTHALQGNFGTSFRTGATVSSEIAQHIVPTLELTLCSLAWAVLLGTVIGVVAAVYHSRWPDQLSMSGAVLGISAPEMWIGLMAIAVFSVRLGWFPVGGTVGLQGIILPSFTLGLGVCAITARFTRTSLVDVLNEDFIRTAYAKGLGTGRVVMRHGLRNALLPVITMTGLQLGFLLGGSVIVETVFSWPGIGQLLVASVGIRDYPVIQALMLVFSLEFLVINLVVDVLYAIVDPRIHLQSKD